MYWLVRTGISKLGIGFPMWAAVEFQGVVCKHAQLFWNSILEMYITGEIKNLEGREGAQPVGRNVGGRELGKSGNP